MEIIMIDFVEQADMRAKAEEAFRLMLCFNDKTLNGYQIKTKIVPHNWAEDFDFQVTDHIFVKLGTWHDQAALAKTVASIVEKCNALGITAQNVFNWPTLNSESIERKLSSRETEVGPGCTLYVERVPGLIPRVKEVFTGKTLFPTLEILTGLTYEQIHELAKTESIPGTPGNLLP
jgi:hypothetical protein